MPAEDKQNSATQEALRIKACWTEPLVSGAELASSMGIVKWNGAATKAFEMGQEVQWNMRTGILLSVGEFKSA